MITPIAEGGADVRDLGLDVGEAIEQLNDRLRGHGGSVEVVSHDPATSRMSVRLIGLCTTCPAWPMTLYATITPFLRDALGITEVTIEGRRISTAARDRILAALS